MLLMGFVRQIQSRHFQLLESQSFFIKLPMEATLGRPHSIGFAQWTIQASFIL